MNSFTQNSGVPQNEPQYGQPQYAQPQYGQPPYGQPPYGQPAPVVQGKKSKFGLISVFVELLCVIIALVGIFRTVNVSIFEIPVVSMLMTVAEQEGEDPIGAYYDSIGDAEDEAENLSDDEVDKIEDATGMTPEEIVALMEIPSVNNLIKFVEMADSVEELEDEIDREIIDTMKIIRGVLIGYGAVVMLFALLAALLKNRALSIIGLIISVLYFVALVGFIFLILYAIATIVHVVLVSKHKKIIRGY